MRRSTYFTRVLPISGNKRQLPAEGGLPPGKEHKCVFYEALAIQGHRNSVIYEALATQGRGNSVIYEALATHGHRNSLIYEALATQGHRNSIRDKGIMILGQGIRDNG